MVRERARAMVRVFGPVLRRPERPRRKLRDDAAPRLGVALVGVLIHHGF